MSQKIVGEITTFVHVDDSVDEKSSLYRLHARKNFGEIETRFCFNFMGRFSGVLNYIGIAEIW